MQPIIKRKYERLVEKLGINDNNTSREMNYLIRASLHKFCQECKNPAIWCMGAHTRMLMTDFMNELKKVRFIIDKNQKNAENVGFQLIGPDDIEAYGIDGVIISSYIYKDGIKEELKKRGMQYLDIYECLEEEGIILHYNYYSLSHPYHRYIALNQLQESWRKEEDNTQKEILIRKIISEYITIKDFKTALIYIYLLENTYHKPDDISLRCELQEIYNLQKNMMASISDNNVVMFCIDGLRRQDLLGGKLPDLLNWVNKSTYFYANAYSSSTSTYESLIPVYSENNDLRTEYYNLNQIQVENCQFIKIASAQKRKIYFYTDTDNFIDCGEIVRSGRSQTATEKMWDFMLDADGTEHGLFYVHILYESHYSYPNPYTEKKIVADGSNIMFDFLETKGGKLRTDYRNQQEDALLYLNDVLTPLLELINCRLVLYADHGNILMDASDGLERLDDMKYTFHNDLIQVPIAIRTPEMSPGQDDCLISLMELNNIVNCLLNQEIYQYKEKSFIKVQRSQIYNPDFKYIYQKYGHAKGLQAFELFIFTDGYRLAVYADGTKELYDETDRVENELKLQDYLQIVKKEISVYSE